MREVRGLLTSDAFGDVVATVMDNNPGTHDSTAGRVVAEALKFVMAVGKFPGVYVQPSRVVDEGWHALILHTALYAKLCDRLGCFVHHYPERPDASRHAPDALMRTAALIEQAGFTHSQAGRLRPDQSGELCLSLLRWQWRQRINRPEVGRAREVNA